MAKCNDCEIVSIIYLMLERWLELLDEEKDTEKVKMEIITMLKTIKK